MQTYNLDLKNISIDQCVNICSGRTFCLRILHFSTVLHTYTISQFNEPLIYDLHRASFVTKTKTKNFVKNTEKDVSWFCRNLLVS